jgi:hypothetical protein
MELLLVACRNATFPAAIEHTYPTEGAGSGPVCFAVIRRTVLGQDGHLCPFQLKKTSVLSILTKRYIPLHGGHLVRPW